MPYNTTFLRDINIIIDAAKIDQLDGPNGALNLFSNYLVSIQNIGSFSYIDWNKDWRSRISFFSELVKDKFPQKFIDLVNGAIANVTVSNTEVLEFIKTEIQYPFFRDKNFKDGIIELIKKYPFNPEFRHTYGHILAGELNLLEAIENYKIAHTLEKSNNQFITSRFQHEQAYLNELIIKEEYQKGIDYIVQIRQDTEYTKSDIAIETAFVSHTIRFKDYIFREEKAVKRDNEILEKLDKRLQEERLRIIEVLGFFSAVVAFILSTVSLGSSFGFTASIYFLVGLAIVLILFNVSLGVIFQNNKTDLNKDPKFWILVVVLLFLIIYLLRVNEISAILHNIGF